MKKSRLVCAGGDWLRHGLFERGVWQSFWSWRLHPEPSLRKSVEAFVLARTEADELTKQKRINDGIKKLLIAHQELDDAFDRKYTKDYKFRQKSKSFFEYLEADRFLDGLAAQIARMQATGDASAFDGRLKFEGKNLIEFLTYMSSNGLQFHAAKPGNEAAYHKLFELMRDVSATASTILAMAGRSTASHRQLMTWSLVTLWRPSTQHRG